MCCYRPRGLKLSPISSWKGLLWENALAWMWQIHHKCVRRGQRSTMVPAETEAQSFASGRLLLKDPGCTCCSLAHVILSTACDSSHIFLSVSDDFKRVKTGPARPDSRSVFYARNWSDAVLSWRTELFTTTTDFVMFSAHRKWLPCFIWTIELV